jgi:hypothetical protein
LRPMITDATFGVDRPLELTAGDVPETLSPDPDRPPA